MEKLNYYNGLIHGDVAIIVRDEAKGTIVEKHKHKDVSQIDGKLWEYDVRAIGYGSNGWIINLVSEGSE